MARAKNSRYAQLGPGGIPSDLDGRRKASRPHLTGRFPALYAVFPTPGARVSEQSVDLKRICLAPRTGQALADAYLEWGKNLDSKTRRTAVENLAAGWCAFVVEREATDLALNEISQSLVNQFAVWLNQSENEKARWKVRTRSQRLGVFLGLYSELIRHPKWGSQVNATTLEVTVPWRGESRRAIPREILPREQLGKLYSACEFEIGQTIRFVEDALPKIAEAFKLLEVSPSTINLREPSHLIAKVISKHDGKLPGGATVKADREFRRFVTAYPGGWDAMCAPFMPRPRMLTPFCLLLGIHFAYNPETLLASHQDDYELYTLFGQERIKAQAFKGRSERRQIRSHASSPDIDNPASIIRFLEKWTSFLRLRAVPALQGRLFLFRITEDGYFRVATYEQEKLGAAGCGAWVDNLKAFIADHKLDKFTLGQIRPTVLDLAHELFVGDLRAVKATGQQRSAQVIQSHYTSDAAKQRNYESLAEVMATRERWRRSGGRIDVRSRSDAEDLGCATPGWHCLDPYAGVMPGQTTGQLCSALGMCPVCPLGHLDVKSAYACARSLQLLSRIAQLSSEIAPTVWLAKWAKVASKLKDYWIPLFTDDVMRESVRLSMTLPSYPTLH